MTLPFFVCSWGFDEPFGGTDNRGFRGQKFINFEVVAGDLKVPWMQCMGKTKSVFGYEKMF